MDARHFQQPPGQQRRIAQQPRFQDRHRSRAALGACRHGANALVEPLDDGAMMAVPPHVARFDHQHHGEEQQHSEA
jgi:hypothetical protein